MQELPVRLAQSTAMQSIKQLKEKVKKLQARPASATEPSDVSCSIQTAPSACRNLSPAHNPFAMGLFACNVVIACCILCPICHL